MVSNTFTTQQLIAWAEKQKEWADSYWTRDLTGPEAYERALNHLIYFATNPITEII